MKREDIKPGQIVSVWGRFDPEEKPEVLSVKPNGVWVMRAVKTLTGSKKITKERLPFHAIALA
jgi:hypothetical protein